MPSQNVDSGSPVALTRPSTVLPRHCRRKGSWGRSWRTASIAVSWQRPLVSVLSLVCGGGRAGARWVVAAGRAPLCARAFVPLRSPLPIAQLALVPLPFLRPLFLPCLPVRRTRALCPRRGKCGIPNECGTGKEESRFVPQVKS